MQTTPDSNTANAQADERRWTTRALIVDDDVPIRELLCDYLARFNIQSTGVTDGNAMREALAEETYDVVVLDLMLPGEDGLSLCRWLRSSSDIPILMLTARCGPSDRSIALELGADDYLAKPFNPRELLARIHAVLRRRPAMEAPGAPALDAQTVTFGPFVFDLALRRLTKYGEQIALTTG